MSDNRKAVIEMHGIRKSFYVGEPNELEILHGVDLTVRAGEFVSIVGASGSGKSTLMNIIGVLDKPTAGSVVLDGRELSKVGDADAAAFRRDNLGFVFQEFNLLDTFSLKDNIFLPLVLEGKHYREIDYTYR